MKIGGYGDGDYFGVCYWCGTEFTGDKRATQCLECAVNEANKDRKELSVLRGIVEFVLEADEGGTGGTYNHCTSCVFDLIDRVEDMLKEIK